MKRKELLQKSSAVAAVVLAAALMDPGAVQASAGDTSVAGNSALVMEQSAESTEENATESAETESKKSDETSGAEAQINKTAIDTAEETEEEEKTEGEENKQEDTEMGENIRSESQEKVEAETQSTEEKQDTDETAEKIQTTQSGWIKRDDSYYYEKDGAVQFDQFVKDGDKVYYVASDGKMAAGESFGTYVENPVTGEREWHWYYADESGKLVKGWRKDEEGRYVYYKSDYTRAAGIVRINGSDYGFERDTGYLYQDQIFYDDDGAGYSEYRADKNGCLIKGWYIEEGEKSYYRQNGKRAWGLTEIDGYEYFFNSSMEKDCFKIWGDTIYYFGEDGKALNKRTIKKDGWFQGGECWAYIKNGSMLTSTFFELGGTRYYFYWNGHLYMDSEFDICSENGEYEGTYRADKNGKIITGWYDNDQYYGQDGKKQKGIVKIKDEYYYFDYNGFLETNRNVEEYQANGETVYYRTDEKGRLVQGIYTDEAGDTCYYGNDFKRKSGIFTVNGKTYCFQPFLMKDYVTTENGYLYYFDEKGELSKKSKITKDRWYTENDQDYYIKNNTMIKNQALKINGKMYYFDESGRLVKDQEFSIYNAEKNMYTYYKANPDGSLVIGWDEDKRSYYFSDGRCADGVVQIDGKTYYFENGYQQRDCVVASNGFGYYFDEDGNMEKKQEATKDCWFQAGGRWYYIRNGELVKNEFITVNNKKYYLDYEGKMYHYGWFSVYDSVEDKEFEYYAEESGNIVTGWYDGVYYCDENGRRQEGIMRVDGLLYDFAPEMKRNTAEIKDGTLYYFASDGVSTISQKAPKNGWVFMTENWYYVKNNCLVKGKRVKIDGYEYVFDLSGKMIYDDVYQDWSSETVAVYKIDHKGHASLITGWRLVDDGAWHVNKWYYFNKKGCPILGFCNVEGKTYYISDDGMLADETVVEEDPKEGIRYLYYLGKDGVLKGKVKFKANGWMNVAGGWYYAEFGSLKRNEWCYVDSTRYYFGKNGRMYANQYVKKETTGEEYYINAEGKEVKGWYRNSSGGWMYRNKDGAFYSGIQKVNDTVYCFDKGVMCTNLKGVYQGKLYQFGSNGKGTPITKNGWVEDYYIQNGKVTTGWKFINKKWYYFSKNGKKCRTQNDRDDKYYVDGNYYYLLSNGTMLRGWIKNKDRNWRYAEQDGKLKNNGWFKDENNKWYYFQDTIMQNGISYVENAYQLFEKNGVWVRKLTAKDNGWIKCGQTYYYVEKGIPMTGKEQKINGKWYSFESDGKMRQEGKYVNTATGISYYFDKTGAAVQNTWKEMERGKYWYFDADGKAVKNGWKKIDGKWYYFENFYRATGNRIIQNKKYDFGTNGAWNGKEEQLTKGWKQVQGFYYYWDQRILTGMHQIEKKTYYFAEDGKLAYAQVIYDSLRKAYYYAAKDGAIVKSAWCNGGTSYAGADGKLYTGIHTINGKKYIFSKEGVLRKEDILSEDGTEVYLISKSGEIMETVKAKKNGWVKTSKGTWYRVQQGVFLHDQVYRDGNNVYYLKKNGVMLKNDFATGVGFADKNGVISTSGWNQGRYWKDDTWKPYFANGAIDINGKNYYFKNGVVSEGLYFADGNYYLYQKNGTRTKKTISEGWNQEGKSWYYKNADGSLSANGIQKIGQSYYEFAEDGKMLTNTFTGEHFYQEDGSMLCSSWKKINGNWYYFDQNGDKVVGTMKINGKNYLFDGTGKII